MKAPQKSKVAQNGKSCLKLAPESEDCQNVTEQIVAKANNRSRT